MQNENLQKGCVIVLVCRKSKTMETGSNSEVLLLKTMDWILHLHHDAAGLTSESLLSNLL